MSVLMNTEAGPAWVDINEWMEAEQRVIRLERTESSARREMEELAKLDPTAASDICFEILEKLAYQGEQNDGS